MNEIKAFVDKFASVPSSSNLTNMYSGQYGKQLCDNLINYLYEMIKLNPQYMLIGEAAGPNGALRTGIPFTDEVILSCGPIEIGGQSIFNYQYSLPFVMETLVPEQSAQRIWEVIKSEKVIPLMWNAVPFYPHKIGTFEIRNPSEGEVRKWSFLIKELSVLFPSIKHYAGVGRKAQIGIVEAFGRPTYIKHPSRSITDFTSMATQFLRSI